MIARLTGIVASALLMVGCTGEPDTHPNIEAIMAEDVIAGIERRISGRIGMALTDENGNLLRAYRGDERFALCSTFKLALSAAVLERAEAGDMTLEDALAFGEADLLDYAPAARDRLDEGMMTVAQAAEAISTLSDNTAANLLLAEIGGPEGMTAFFRRHGDEVSRLDRIEPELNENAEGDERDTTSPVAMAGLVQRLMFGDVMGEQARTQLADWTIANQTGDTRIRAGVPEGWTVGDKTGSCGNAFNDIGIIWPPSGPAFVLAIYIDRPTADPEEVDFAMEEIAELAVLYMSERNIG